MAIKSKPTALNGINPLAYVGVNPYTPPAMYQLPRAPGVRDNAGFQIGDFWMNETNNDLWYLAKKSNPPQYQDALWVLLNNGSDLETLTGDIGGPVGPDASRNINTLGTAGQILVTGNPGTNTLTWSLDGSIATSYPTDSGIAVPSGNILNIITNNAANNCGSTMLFTGSGNTVQLNVTSGTNFSTYYGLESGVVGSTAIHNAGFGYQCFSSITTGDSNAGFGYRTLRFITSGAGNTGCGEGSLNLLTTGDGNTALGQHGLLQLVTGSDNTVMGAGAGDAYVGAESSNICIGSNAEGFAGESNTLRIGANAGSGVGPGQLNRAFIHGIHGVTPAATDIQMVVIDNAGQLGTSGAAYSTGTWEPELAFAGASVGITYTYRGAAYTQIGNKVFIDISINLSSKGTSVGQMQITNLPFTVTSAYGPPFMDTAEISQGNGITLTAGYENFWGNFIAGGTVLQIIQGSNAGAIQTAFTDANISDTGNFTITGWYTV